MEPVRPEVDAFVLDLLEGQVFTSRDFVELSNGVCRVRATLTHDLALTLPKWRMPMAPIVAHLAQAFRAPTSRSQAFQERTSHRANGNAARKMLAHSPLNTTPRKVSKPRPYASKAWGTPRPEGLALFPAACASCGEPVLKRRRRYCEACLLQARRARGERAIKIAREALARQVRNGEDPRATSQAGRKRGAANAEHHLRNREWRREHTDTHDRGWFLREVTPKLDALSLSEIAQATGLSLAACSRFRAGARVPHPRHWSAFVALVEESPQIREGVPQPRLTRRCPLTDRERGGG